MFNELSIGMNKNLEIISYEDKNVIFRGFIDKIIRKDNTLILIDYKTGKYHKDMKWDQLLYYGISLFNMMPYDKIVLMNVFVEHLKFNKTALYRKDVKKIPKSIINKHKYY